ncbi:MAG TPA: ribbon-helix-helix domain-containing protein [Desulfomonilia bacterium]|nr:ribbon-helix-helix domain-containing protein [Desulfomonilia bacterium]
MSVRGRKPLELRSGDKNAKLIKRNYYIEERYAKALTVLSALTGKELSLLVNEAIGDLIKKYQPMTDIDLLRLKTIKKED